MKDGRERMVLDSVSLPKEWGGRGFHPHLVSMSYLIFE